MKHSSLIILIVLLLTACGPSAEQMTATAIMAQAQTQTAAPTLTSTPTRTPTLTPSITPSPTPALPQILGNVQLNFIKLDPKVVIPEPPYDLEIKLSPASSETEISIKITDAHGGFSANLAPGEYTINSLQIQSPEIAVEPVEILTDQPSFTVSTEDCHYVGNLTVTIVRLPPGPFDYQMALVAKATRGQPVFFQFHETGGFLMPASTEIADAGACPN